MDHDISRRGRVLHYGMDRQHHRTHRGARNRSPSHEDDSRTTYIAHLESLVDELNLELQDLTTTARKVRGLEREVQLLKSEVDSWEKQAEEWEAERERFRRRIKTLEEEKKKDREQMLKEIKEIATGAPTPAATPSPLPSAWGEVEELRRRWTTQNTASSLSSGGGSGGGLGVMGTPTPTRDSLRRPGISPPKSLVEEPISPSRSPSRGDHARPRWSSHSHSASTSSSFGHPPSFTHSRTPSTASVQTPHTHHGRQRSNSAISSRSYYNPHLSSPLSSPKPHSGSKAMRRFAPGEPPQPLFLPAASALHSHTHSPRSSVAPGDLDFESLQSLVSPDGLGVMMNPLGDSLFKELARAENRRLEEEAESSHPGSPHTNPISSTSHSRVVSGTHHLLDPHKTPTPPTSSKSPDDNADSDSESDEQLDAEWWSITSILRATQAYDILRKLWGDSSDPNQPPAARRKERRNAVRRLRRISSTLSISGSSSAAAAAAAAATSTVPPTHGGASIAPSTPSSIPSFPSAFNSPTVGSSAGSSGLPQQSPGSNSHTSTTNLGMGILDMVRREVGGMEAFARESRTRRMRAETEQWVLLVRLIVVVGLFVGYCFKGEKVFEIRDEKGGEVERVELVPDGAERGEGRRRKGRTPSLILGRLERGGGHRRSESRILPAEEWPSSDEGSKRGKSWMRR